jgi:hypothetical protein
MLAGSIGVLAAVGGFLLVQDFRAPDSSPSSSDGATNHVGTFGDRLATTVSVAIDDAASMNTPTHVVAAASATDPDADAVSTNTPTEGSPKASPSGADLENVMLEPVVAPNSDPIIPVKRTAAVRAKQTNKTGKLAVVVPRGASAEVVVAGKKLAIRRDDSISLPPGRHVVTVRAPDRAPEKIRVEVVAGKTTTRVVKLQPAGTSSTAPKSGSGAGNGSDDDRMLFNSGEVKARKQ